MEKIRLDASAYYRNLPPAEKQRVKIGFSALDKTGSGKVSLKQYSEYFKQRGLVELTYPYLFKALDTNGDGRLDFNEYITVYYLCMNNKMIFCEECGVFLSGSYMSCLQCFDNDSGDPYNICYDCYNRNNIDHHKDATFVDDIKLQCLAVKGSADNNGSTTRSSGGKITTRDKLRTALLVVSAVKLGVVASSCSVM
ncbi:hypothetical protein JCGZ_12879 [Jatropha curcas]|uniref:EF-hand domain-containing protein n=1 Tax=Jatropha curcas TaxID=180498 RepID=A0A067KM26_JATCU|nr:hypothetical protein JCGZ_12879 [Jatropha curcas]